jgi:hypothetical protein
MAFSSFVDMPFLIGTGKVSDIDSSFEIGFGRGGAKVGL